MEQSSTIDHNEWAENRQKSIDQMSMALLLNKTHYQKYLSKTDSQKHAEYLEFLDKCRIHGSNIVEITKSLLSDPDPRSNITVSQEVLEAFEQYSKTLIKYLEIVKDSEENYKRNFNEEGDDDIMFSEPISLLHGSDTGFKFFAKRN